MKNSNNIALAFSLSILAIATRLLPHLENFSALFAVVFLLGILSRTNFKLSVFTALFTVVASDVALGFAKSDFATYTFSLGQVAIWFTYTLVFGVGYFTKKFDFKNLAIGGVTASILFFLISNVAVWVEGQLYARTFQGFIDCFFNAIPFYRGALEVGSVLVLGLISQFVSQKLSKPVLVNKSQHPLS